LDSGAAGLWVAIGVAVLSMLVVAGLLVLVVRSRQSDTDRLEAAIREQGTRMEAAISGLSGSTEIARVESDRTRRLGEIGSTIDLEEVLQRVLEVAGTMPFVDAAMVAVNDNGKPVVATMGLSEHEAHAQPPYEVPDGLPTQVVHFRYPEPADGEGDAIRGGVAIPLRGESEEPIGTLRVFWRGVDREPGEPEIAEVKELAAMAAPAVENARRFQEARQLADVDALTGLHNRRFFYETLAREVSRAHRYERPLSLIVCDIDNFKTINDSIGHLAGDAVLAEAAERVQSVVRGADIACRVGGDEFAVILPESTLDDAKNLYKRLQHSIATWRGGGLNGVAVSAGIAELRAEDDEIAFFGRADSALYRAKHAGRGRAISAGEDADEGEETPALPS
jgi:diguanylate cyclase (GGDEF)-like protein